ncbi:MAG: FlgD immunoglobulin-like domain containing protein [Candidatus Neomarinimicrobiota bacterium]
MYKTIFIYLFLSNLSFGQYSFLGSFEVSSASYEITVSDSLQMDYTLYNPINHESEVSILLVHGFSRDQSVMAGFAEHFASWGLLTITMNLLHSSIIDNDPVLDALDINILADQVGQGLPIVYVGHSSGGMRSVLAASQNSNVIGVLGLDLVDALYLGTDNQYYGLSVASNMMIPVWGMFGESSACNANSNGVNIFQEVVQGNAVIITEADHCDFELPTNFFCSLLCGQENYIFSDDDIEEVVLNLSTSFILDIFNFDETNIELWDPGNNYYDSLVTVGALQQITSLSVDGKMVKPEFFNLYQNFPNPFNSLTNIKYEVFKSGNVNLVIINSKGLHVKSIVNKYHQIGKYLMEWDGMDDQGRNMASGIYFHKIILGGMSKTEKMIYIK